VEAAFLFFGCARTAFEPPGSPALQRFYAT